jgi:hypothetical protein
VTATVQTLPRDLPPATSAANVAKRLALVLASQIGYREGKSGGDWNNDNAYGKYFGQNGVSWCNWFQSWGAVAAAIPASVIPRTGYTPSSWNWFVDHSRDVKTPRAGDLFWVYGYVASEGGSRVHHIGFVEKVLSGGRIQTLEGNTNVSGSTQGNGVYRLTRTISSKLRFARPNYAAAIQAAIPPKPPAKPPVTKPVNPPIQEDDMPNTEAELEHAAGIGVHGQKLGRSDVTIGAAIETTMKDASASRAMLGSLTVQVAGLSAAVKTLAESQNVDPDAIIAAVTEATDKAMADLKITLSVDPAPEA